MTGTSVRPILMGLIALAFSIALVPQPASSQSGDGWTQLFDGKTVGDWNLVGETNWRVEDGAIVADKRTSKDPAYLVSKTKYKDLAVYVEFWSSDDANSGVFLRCQDPTTLTDRNCYEANIFDQRPDPTYGTGAIVRFAEVDPMPKAGGKWNTYEITVKGRDVILVLNGKETSRLRSELLMDGHLALQHGSGVMKFRKVAIKPL